MSTIKVINSIHPSGSTNNLVFDSSGNTTAGGTLAMSSSFLRNRIINGDMRVFQRGTAATATGDYCLDRWTLVKSNSATTSTTQSTDVPSGQGFSYSMKTTVSVASGTVGAAQYELLRQIIEGYNIADFNWGSSAALSVTLSFWVKSSVTGTYSGSFNNGPTEDRLCPFSYVVNAANTWEYKTVTIPGNTSSSGTAWGTTNGIGLIINWYTLLGSNYTGGTAGVWGTTPNYGVPSTNALATIGNTFAITGVQLEVGSVATPFERRLYATELNLCERYYQFAEAVNEGYVASGTNSADGVTFRQTMRSAPTLSMTNLQNGGVSTATYSAANINTYGAGIYCNASGGGTYFWYCKVTANAEL